MKRKHIVLAVAGVLAAVLLAAWPRPEPEVLYEVVFLPTFARYVGPHTINDQGQITGQLSLNPYANSQGVVLTPIRKQDGRSAAPSVKNRIVVRTTCSSA